MKRRAYLPRVMELDGDRFEIVHTGRKATVYVRPLRRRDKEGRPIYGPLRKATYPEVVRVHLELRREREAQAERDRWMERIAPRGGGDQA